MLISLDVYVVFQAFTISQLKSGRSDAGEFRCAATNAKGDDVDMVKGRMIVVHSEQIFYICLILLWAWEMGYIKGYAKKTPINVFGHYLARNW